MFLHNSQEKPGYHPLRILILHKILEVAKWMQSWSDWAAMTLQYSNVLC